MKPERQKQSGGRHGRSKDHQVILSDIGTGFVFDPVGQPPANQNQCKSEQQAPDQAQSNARLQQLRYLVMSAAGMSPRNG
ncbi:MAG TPA: hypothetical protein DCF68_12460 [Cyanothece sp. UBA12306]|nr:hypothetical protein [Cyanothece sp. UBA12306]